MDHVGRSTKLDTASRGYEAIMADIEVVLKDAESRMNDLEHCQRKSKKNVKGQE